MVLQHKVAEVHMAGATLVQRKEFMGSRDLFSLVEVVGVFRRGMSNSVWLQFGGVNSFNKLQFINRCFYVTMLRTYLH